MDQPTDQQHTEPSDATREAEAVDAVAKPSAAPQPSPEEEAAAERAQMPDGVPEAYQDYVKKAADLPGEGRIP
jgi:hypothetical protein